MAKGDSTTDDHLGSIRETVESIWIAIVLAFVLRAFVVEAFMIPTGSMAPRLMGKHAQFDCPACGYHYSFGVHQSKEAKLSGPIEFRGTRCPNCWYEPPSRSQWAYGGDRVLVLKYLYRFREPQAWDVVVFKNPLNNSENYIKRLIGLPGEQIEIVHGNVFFRRCEEDFNGDGKIDGEDFDGPRATDWRILEKPPKTQEVMWQIIYDNDYQPDPAVYAASGRTWEPPWRDPSNTGRWKLDLRGGRVFEFLGSPGPAELRFDSDADRFYPNYAYNKPNENRYRPEDVNYDLKLSFTFIPRAADSCVGLHLSSFNDHFEAWLSAEGQAELTHGEADPAGSVALTDDWGRDAMLPKLEPGRGYEVALTHVDRQVTLWLDGKPVLASKPTQYSAEKDHIIQLVNRFVGQQGRPLPAPTVAILAKAGPSELWHVKLMRDVYYTCPTLVREAPGGDAPTNTAGHGTTGNPMVLKKFLEAPDRDEFFVLGDNSPASKDSRMWGFGAPTLRQPYVEGTVPRYNLMGKAFFVYWPGGYRLQVLRQLPVVPNVGRMRLIR